MIDEDLDSINIPLHNVGSTTGIEQITFGIFSTGRKDYIEQCIKSIARFYGNAFVKVEIDENPNCAKNKLLKTLETEYLLLIPDDTYFLENTKVEYFVDILQTDTEIGQIGCCEHVSDVLLHNRRDLELFRERLYGYKSRAPKMITMLNLDFFYCDMINSFQLVRREAANQLWFEDTDLTNDIFTYWQRKQKGLWRTAYTPHVTYHYLRDGSVDYVNRMSKEKVVQHDWLEANGIIKGYAQMH